MTDKKQPTKRPVAMGRLYTSIETFIVEHGMPESMMISELLTAIKNQWFDNERK